MRQLSKILIALVIIVATVLCTDIIFGKIADQIFINRNITQFEYLVNDRTNPEILFLGSSRAEAHYDTPFINDSLGISAINLGASGRGLTYHDAVFNVYLKQHQPDIIILEVMPDALTGNINNRVKALYPYIVEYPEITEIATKVDSWNSYFLKSNLLRYNTEIFELVKKHRHPYNSKSFGFIPLALKRNSYRDLKETVIDGNSRNSIDDVAKGCLLDIIYKCKQRNIELIVAYSPEFSIRNYVIPVTTICDSLGIPVIDARGFRSPKFPEEYFSDNRHLNKLGAREYTRYFMEVLDSISETQLTKVCQK